MNYESKMNLSGAADHLIGEDAESDAPRSRKWLWLLLAIGLALALLAWFLARGDEQAAFTQQRETAAAVTVVAPGTGTVQGVINATGTLAARREMPVGVVGEGGRVLAVRVEAGDWVNAGQVLAVIDRSVQNQQAASQAAQIQVAQANADLAQANLDRARQLVARGFISQADIDRLTATRDAAQAQVSVARAQLGERQARNAQLNIVAPAAGLVLERRVEPGQVVGAGSGVLFSIARGGETGSAWPMSVKPIWPGLPIGASGHHCPGGDGQGIYRPDLAAGPGHQRDRPAGHGAHCLALCPRTAPRRFRQRAYCQRRGGGPDAARKRDPFG